jgi:hypothetical protein
MNKEARATPIKLIPMHHTGFVTIAVTGPLSAGMNNAIDIKSAAISIVPKIIKSVDLSFSLGLMMLKENKSVSAVKRATVRTIARRICPK